VCPVTVAGRTAASAEGWEPRAPLNRWRRAGVRKESSRQEGALWSQPRSLPVRGGPGGGRFRGVEAGLDAFHAAASSPSHMRVTAHASSAATLMF